MEPGVCTPKEFPCTGDPFEGLDDKAKKLFQDCQDLNQTSIEESLETLDEVTLKQSTEFHSLISELKERCRTLRSQMPNCTAVNSIRFRMRHSL